MAVDTGTQQWATREEVAQDRERVQALTAAQAQDRDKLSRLDEKIKNSVRIDRHSATQAGVEKAIDSVQSDIKSVQSDIKSVQIEQAGVKASLHWMATREDLARLETKLIRLLLSIGVPLILGMAALLYRQFIP